MPGDEQGEYSEEVGEVDGDDASWVKGWNEWFLLPETERPRVLMSDRDNFDPVSIVDGDEMALKQVVAETETGSLVCLSFSVNDVFVADAVVREARE